MTVTEVDANDVRNVIIVGSGPAGYTAAIYTARANLNPVVFTGSVTAGGELMNTTDVENYPGFPDGILGPELMANFEAQARRFGADIQYEDVVDVDLASHPKVVTLGNGDSYRARTVIIATGSAYRHLGIDGEQRLSGFGVSWCATCDGFFFRDQQVAVVGGGDSAMEEALFLTKFASKVYVIHRRDELRASHIMAQRALENDKIEFIWDSVVTHLSGEDKLHTAGIENLKTGQRSTLDISGLFVAIGQDPRTELVKDVLDLNDDGTIKVAHPSSQTNIDGVFAAGDVIDPTYRQAVTAAGTGCVAAQDVEHYLINLG
ncbi:thioredoxin-disulfide reductase [Auritidibacter ignavus]|uniref:thioredoxin-disulfide reductase n=1 Tax=Auritidibacter ignavus TaxID=678932 RepID=UPI0024BB76F1|nr:thioredoxin-disulfide reductase [Auritidibacter ignavus]WHS36153.1 thioredoxin-disulfide reductase [Auritidibacter ignavus]